ncbi:hypothetical protein [Nocardia amikacinitolerans]|uniref:hypothetical protein n=1 Tax=Nocardia amikacinitolerans TaxID=756689 RepID=UPI0020A27380|nr:hypothetical protein [Nocardia amikacinitolerans]MCP2290806.1 hypothetical protein [Nocardia amikacinitolerans]
MSKKKNTTTAPTAPAAPAPETGSRAGVVPALRNDTDRALWAALGTRPGSTTAALADAAGIGVSTARRLLTNWETAGAARSATDTASPRAAKTWTAGSAAPQPAAEPAAPASADPDPATPDPATTEPATPESAPAESAAPEPVSPERATPEPADPVPDNAESTVERLPAGALRGQVEDFLRDNPGKEFSPHQIGKALDRSSGAVHNALVTLTKSGTVHQTSTAPKKFTLAS